MAKNLNENGRHWSPKLRALRTKTIRACHRKLIVDLGTSEKADAFMSEWVGVGPRTLQNWLLGDTVPGAAIWEKVLDLKKDLGSGPKPPIAPKAPPKKDDVLVDALAHLFSKLSTVEKARFFKAVL